LEDIMVKRIAAVVAILLVPALLGISVGASIDNKKAADLTVHEWGTFTSVAGPDGKAVQWLPLAGPGDLPCFVNYYKNLLYKSFGPSPVLADIQKNSLDYEKARQLLLGPIRMETPVVYFYSQKPQQVNVRVAFPKGFITEWYPQAAVNQTPVRAGVLQKSQDTASTIVWKNVQVMPGLNSASFPKGSSSSHYYAARETDATPLRVNGAAEKFLFYRGVGGFAVPVNVTTTDSGKVHIKHLTGKPAAILFEARGGKLGYTIVDTSKNEAIVDVPSLTSDFESLREDLEAILVREGLYEKEAQAMVETWRDSWFEEGTRLFYIVPSAMVDQILPLTVEPQPAKVARVFVGRVEVFTPATIKAVQDAIYTGDTSVVATYGRFLGPIMDRIPASERGNMVLDSAFRNYVAQAAKCAN
jgi:hypothetical protein